MVLVALTLAVFQAGAQGLENAAKHLGAGVAIGAVGGYAANKLFQGSPEMTWAGAAGSALAAGLAKEIHDVSSGNQWQTDDVVFSALGGFLAGVALDILLKDKGGKGKNRRGKGCGCLVVDNDTFSKTLPTVIPNTLATGSGDLTASLQAAYFINGGL